MRYYIRTEIKRLIHTLPGFLSALAGTLFLALFMVLLAQKFLPEVLEVKPFRIGLCVEGDDRMSAYVKEYVQQMESTENLMEFQEMESAEAEEALQNGELAACIIIPEKTAKSIMDGSNIPIRVLTGNGADNAERYMQRRLLKVLMECGAVMIDVPQAETLLLYEWQVENAEELGVTLDLFHFGLVLDREGWFEREEVSAFGNVDIEEYYLAAGGCLLFLFWGLGSGSFFGEQEKNLPLVLARRGISPVFQQGVKQVLYILFYMVPGVLCLLLVENTGSAGQMMQGGAGGVGSTAIILLCAAMAALQCGFFFELAPTAAGGIALNSIWSLTGFFGAGGILPAVFLPEALTEVCSHLPAGLCMEALRQMVGGARRASGGIAANCLFWCLFFGVGGQLVFCGRQWSKGRR